MGPIEPAGHGMTIKEGTLLRELGSIVGDGYVVEPAGDDPYEVDEVRPQILVSPGSDEEVAGILAFANAHLLAVIPHGARWHTGLGNVPRRYDIALSTKRLDKILEYEPADMTVSCQAGIKMSELHGCLESNQQFLPLPRGPQTPGGLLAANASPPNAHHGQPRDFTIGLRFVTGDDLRARSGGRVVKNVAGYDLTKLHIGALGTLGVITSANFKVFPKPQVREHRWLRFISLGDALTFADEVLREGLTPERLDILTDDGEEASRSPRHALFLVFAGSEAGIKRSWERVERLVGPRHEMEETPAIPITRPEDDDNLTNDRGLVVEVRLVGPHVREFAEWAQHLQPRPEFEPIDLVSARIACVWNAIPASDHEQLIQRVRASCARLRGLALVLFASREAKRRIDVFGDPPPSFPLMRALKQQFDPNGILSPGRFVGRL